MNIMRYATKDLRRDLTLRKTPTHRLYNFSSHARRAENDMSANKAMRNNERLTRQICSPRNAEIVHRSRGTGSSQDINFASFFNGGSGLWPCVQVEDGYVIAPGGKSCDEGKVV